MRSCRHPSSPASRLRWLLVLAALAALSVSAQPAAGADSDARTAAFVPARLLTSAREDPDATFDVVVQGAAGRRSSDVAADVRSGVAAAAAGGVVKRSFRTVNGVSATLSGKEIVRLASRETIAAITPDRAVAVAGLALPTIAGTPRVGEKLTAHTDGWPSDGAYAYIYEWQRCDSTGASCEAVAGATGATYEPTATDVGSHLRVAVTAVALGGTTSPGVSLPTAVVTPASGFWNEQQWPYVAGLQRMWERAAGNGPAIAVVDSGVDGSAPGLDGLVTQVALTSRGPNSAGDGRGHGTFVAGIAAGRADAHAGAAPGSKLVSLDVLDDEGRAVTSDVIAAADWIYEHKDAYGIRVANFSLVGSVATTFQFDPLDRAVEKLWLSGVVVVAAAGNYAVDGKESGVRFAPGNDPFVITVGAVDTVGTMTKADDVAAPWSAYGNTPDGFAKPELAAPGRYLIAAVPPNSTLAGSRPERIVAPGYMQLSGTSFAAPVVAGAAADLLAAHPEWTPGQVKAALMLSAVPLPAAAPHSVGVGELDAAAAGKVTSPPDANRALMRFAAPDPAGGPTPVFDAARWLEAATANPSWAAEMWGTEMWGTAASAAEMWGTEYWSLSEMWGTEMWGTEMWGTEMWGTEMWGTAGPDSTEAVLPSYRMSASDRASTGESAAAP